ncbi:hypothetical protein WJX72_010788 [[Myrmecia] bisecta]|uniref:Uncharacterized protein n=1 Tax=[Myrmecia] bisecta TaxID=41462 RepID=A0AAW1QGE8_9CHLO
MNWTLIKFLAVPLALGQVAGLLTAPDILKWYVPKLKKPWYVPPAPIFGAVWPVMYGLMGYASYLVFQHGGLHAQMLPLRWYAIQLGLNVAWQLLFFKVRKLGLAQAENLALLGSIAYTTKLFGQVDPLAGKLMLPYLAWAAFANVINFGVWRSNPQAGRPDRKST